MNVKSHPVGAKAYPAVPAKISFGNSKCTALGIPITDSTMDMKINLWFGVEDAIKFLLNFKLLFACSPYH